MKDFKDKVVFITGGGAGAGFGQAQIFSEAGCKVIIADVRQDHLDQAVAYFKSKNADVHAIKLDITDRKAYIAAADEIERIYGTPPQILIQTAGVNAFGPAEASTYEDFDWIVGVNLGGIINGMVTFVPRMIKAGKGGHIVTVASLGGLQPGPTTAPYSCAKAAVINLMQSYHEALKPYNIGVTAFCPGNMNTSIHEAGKTRPAHLQNSGYFDSPEATEAYRKHNELGLSIREVGEHTKKSIEDGIVLYIPNDDRDQILQAQAERMRDYSTVEGMKKRAAMQPAPPPEMPPEEIAAIVEAGKVGWAKARPDIDWINPNKKA